MSMTREMQGEDQATTRLGKSVRFLRNWAEVWAAYRSGRPLPPFRFRGGLILQHRPVDDLVILFREMFATRMPLNRIEDLPDPDRSDGVLGLIRAAR